MDKIDIVRSLLATPEPFIRWLVTHADDDVGVATDARKSPLAQWLNEVVPVGKPWLISPTRYHEVNVISRGQPMRMAFYRNRHWLAQAVRHLRRVFGGNELKGHEVLASLSAIPTFPYDFTQLEVQTDEREGETPSP